MRSSGWRVGIAIAVAVASPIYADPMPADTDAMARQHFERGKQLASAKDFVHAYLEFAAGYELGHRAPFLFNMAECARVMGDAPRARELYTQYIAASPQGDLAVAARARVIELGGAVPAASPPAPPAISRDVARSIAPPPSAVVQGPVAIEPASPPLWHRASFWIGVGAVLVAGSAAIYIESRRGGSTCTPPACVTVQ